jgi:hypothetical protein
MSRGVTRFRSSGGQRCQRARVIRARNGRAAKARTPVLPEAATVSALSAEAVRKPDTTLCTVDRIID